MISTLRVPLTVLACAVTLGGCAELDPQFGALAQGSEGSDSTGGGGGADAGDDGVVRFKRDLRPLFDRTSMDPTGRGCKGCHYATEPNHVGYDLGGLDLSTLGGLRRGGATSGAAIVVAGDPDASVLMQKLLGTYGFGARMPRGGAPYWTDADLDRVRRWIEGGAKGMDDE